MAAAQLDRMPDQPQDPRVSVMEWLLGVGKAAAKRLTPPPPVTPARNRG